ncbi:MAG: nicotinic acid mononucleotide adenylyltransferase [Gammaproteobacteria bacterium HGW-Gammaproteobacteria-11]|nr:MAG: nicotinic acid mononucleotide adenylyltransferase [Gammaproteobacteria bacterium HGW-Gammaproteobacteria-11]
MMRRIGLLGGTFDPVHHGHLRSAVEVRDLLGLDELRLIPSARPPHRPQPGASAEARLAMLQLAVDRCAGFIVDDCELRREQLSYTADTLESLRAELGENVVLFLILGWDAFCGLPNWHRWESLLQLASLVVLQRPEQDSELPEALKNLMAARSVTVTDDLAAHGQIICLSQTPLAISATQIRGLLSAGRSARFLLPDAVLDYIETHGLYRP